jgi:hypothetical protein
MEMAFDDRPLGVAVLPPASDGSWSIHSSTFRDPLDALLQRASFEPQDNREAVREAFGALNELQRDQVYRGLRRAAELAAEGSCMDPASGEQVSIPADVKVRFQQRVYGGDEGEPFYRGVPPERFVYTKQHRPGRFTVQFSS